MFAHIILELNALDNILLNKLRFKNTKQMNTEHIKNFYSQSNAKTPNDIKCHCKYHRIVDPPFWS